jgi:hypothetical protein
VRVVVVVVDDDDRYQEYSYLCIWERRVHSRSTGDDTNQRLPAIPLTNSKLVLARAVLSPHLQSRDSTVAETSQQRRQQVTLSSGGIVGEEYEYGADADASSVSAWMMGGNKSLLLLVVVLVVPVVGVDHNNLSYC